MRKTEDKSIDDVVAHYEIELKQKPFLVQVFNFLLGIWATFIILTLMIWVTKWAIGVWL